MIAPPTPWHAAGDDQEERRRSRGRRASEATREEDDARSRRPACGRAGRRASRRSSTQVASVERVGVDHPLQVRRRSRRGALDRRQGDVHDRDVEQEHESRRADGDQRPPLPLTRARPGRYTVGILTCMQDVLDVSNEVAAELAGIGDGVLDALRERLDCIVRLRGNRLTLEGDEHARRRGARGRSTSSSSWSRAATRSGRDTVDAVLGALDQRGQDIRDGLRGRRLAPPRQEDRAEDGDAEALRRRDPHAHRHVRDRPGRHGQDVPRDGARGRRAAGASRSARIILTRPAVEAGERLGFLPGDLLAKVDPYLRPLFDALYDMLDPDRLNALHGARHDRGRAARVHARPHAQRLVHHPRRGAEHDARADADVPDAARLRLEGRRHRRRDADRPAARAGARG